MSADQIDKLEAKIDRLLEGSARQEMQHAVLVEKLAQVMAEQEQQDARLQKLEQNMAKIVAWASIVAAGGAGFSTYLMQ